MAVDHSEQAVVVGIRGSMSMKVCKTRSTHTDVVFLFKHIMFNLQVSCHVYVKFFVYSMYEITDSHCKDHYMM